MIDSPSSPRCHWCPIQVNGYGAKGIALAERLAQTSGQAATSKHRAYWDLVLDLPVTATDATYLLHCYMCHY